MLKTCEGSLFSGVLVLAGTELIFFLVAGILLWIQYENNVNNTLMFSVVAKQCLD